MKAFNSQIIRLLAVVIAMTAAPLLAQNLVVNSNFNDNPIGFETDYQHSWGLGGDADVGKYCIHTNAINCGNNMFDFPDHTTGTGYYMIVNGATVADMRVWQEQIAVQPYSYYEFSLWMTNLSRLWIPSLQRSKLQIYINNEVFVNEFYPSNTPTNTGAWNPLTPTTWYSGTATTATIVIYDRCLADNGNDFGLDDISFTYLYSNVVEAHDDEATTCFETPVDINPLANDVITPTSLVPNVDFTILGQPEHGQLQLLSGTNYRYTPNTGYSGNDGFSYRLRYGTGASAISSYGYVDITVNPRPQRIINVDACEQYTWSYDGQTYTQSGSHDYVLNVPNGCDSLLILNLTIHHGDEVTLPAVEECESYTWNGVTYTSSGVYDHQTTTEWGCVRIEHLPLTIHYGDTVDFPVSSCEQYTWYGQTYTQSGTYTHWSTNSFGCDRLERLILTISDRYRQVENLTECDSYYWPRTNQWYYESSIDSVSVNGPQGGCDSTFVLNLTLHFADEIDLDPVEACDSFEWYGQTYTTSGVLTHETTNEFGCDRLEHLNLTIHESENITLPAVTECDAYQWHGTTYTQSGVVVYDTVNQYGCAVQYNLPLTINHSDTLDWPAVMECDSYLWYGQTITESGSYSHNSTNESGCDRLERIYVTINHSTIDTLEPVTACNSYDWHGTTYTQSGIYEYEGEGPTGCSAKEVLRLTINHSSQYEFSVTSCEPYEWYGTVYDEPGTYYHELTNTQGCDSLLIMHLDIGEIYTMEEDVVGCESYEWYGTVYTQGGDYQHEVSSTSGCDSLFIIHLTIAPTFEEEIEKEACYTYTWIDQTYQQSGDYERHFTSESGCDSLVILHLTIKEAVYHDFEQQTCREFTWNGITYYEEGDYEQTFEASNGCDSIATMHLVFSDALTSEFERQACSPIVWEGQLCDHNGDYYHTYQSPQGCDSIVTMHFRLSESIEYEFDTLACEGFNWYGNICNESGQTFTHTFQTPQGCDSIVTMHCDINLTQTYTQFQAACDSILLYGTWYMPGNYFVYYDTVFTDNGCYSEIYRINLTVRNSTEMSQIEGSHEVYVASNIISGIYRYEIDTAGIVSDITWSLTNPNWTVLDHDATSCRIMVTTPGTSLLLANFRAGECGEMERQFLINAGFFDVDEHQGVEACIYPNPTKGTVVVSSEGMRRVRVLNMMGQVLDVIDVIDADSLTVDLSRYAPSVYLLEIETLKGKTQQRVVVCR